MSKHAPEGVNSAKEEGNFKHGTLITTDFSAFLLFTYFLKTQHCVDLNNLLRYARNPLIVVLNLTEDPTFWYLLILLIENVAGYKISTWYIQWIAIYI